MMSFAALQVMVDRSSFIRLLITHVLYANIHQKRMQLVINFNEGQKDKLKFFYLKRTLSCLR